MPERAYSISSQVQVRGMVNGQLVDLYEIHYAGPNGIVGWIRTPVATATAEQVDALIRTALAEQLRIAALGQQTG